MSVFKAVPTEKIIEGEKHYLCLSNYYRNNPDDLDGKNYEDYHPRIIDTKDILINVPLEYMNDDDLEDTPQEVIKWFWDYEEAKCVAVKVDEKIVIFYKIRSGKKTFCIILNGVAGEVSEVTSFKTLAVLGEYITEVNIDPTVNDIINMGINENLAKRSLLYISGMIGNE